MTTFNSQVQTKSSPSSIEEVVSIPRQSVPCAMFVTGLGGTDEVFLQMYVGTDADGLGTSSNWVTVRSGASDVSFTADDNQYVIESPGTYRLKSTVTMTSTTDLRLGIMELK